MFTIDSSSLILLAKASILDTVIKNLKSKLTITNQVYSECAAKTEVFDAKLIKKRIEDGTVMINEIKNDGLYTEIKDDFNLGNGEAESIAFCLENKFGLITDDKKAMNACRILKIRFTTVLNLLIRIYKKGLITKAEADAYLTKLEKFGRYSDEIIKTCKEELK